MSDTIKTLRKEFALTQSELAEKTGLSLRTIQRLEADENIPKGHTLKVIASAFQMDVKKFQSQFKSKAKNKDKEQLSLKLINLSILAFIIFPFGNIILPLILWIRKRDARIIEEGGRKIINFQILWSISLSILLCLAPFIDIGLPIPLIFIVLIMGISINLIVIFKTARAIHNGRHDFLELSLRIL